MTDGTGLLRFHFSGGKIMRRIALIIISCVLSPMASTWAQQFSSPQDFAPGVLKVISPTVETLDSASIRMPLPDLNASQYKPNSFSQSETLYDRTRQIVLFRDIWQYEFSHLGLRQAMLDVPGPSGQLERKNVWYLVYRIRNVGKTVSYDKVTDAVVGIDEQQIVYDRPESDDSTLPGRFIPVFTFVSWVQNPQTGDYDRDEQVDDVLPTVATQIQLEEDPNRDLLDCVQISQTSIPLAKGADDGGVWGVALWTNVDPRANYLSVRIRGVSNAYRLIVNADGSKSMRSRELQLYFYRPGSRVEPVKDPVYPGIPVVDSPKEQAVIARRYELPGPLFKVAEQVNDTEYESRFEADAEMNLDTFISPLSITLNDGKMPDSLAKAFAEMDVSIPDDAAVQTLVPGSKWTISVGSRNFVISLVPEYWERFGEGIRLIKPLDHAWVYR